MIALVRKEYSLSYMKTFLEWHGYFYSLQEIADFIETDFFKKRMQEHLEEVGAVSESRKQEGWKERV